MKTLFIIIFLLANGDMRYGLKQFDDTPACVEHLKQVVADAQTPEGKALIEQRKIVNVITFCSTKMREVVPGAIPAGMR